MEVAQLKSASWQFRTDNSEENDSVEKSSKVSSSVIDENFVMNNMQIFDERLQNAGTFFGSSRQMSYTTEISVSKSWDHKSISQSLSKSGSNGGDFGKTELPHELEWRMKRDVELREYEARKNIVRLKVLVRFRNLVIFEVF